MYYDILNEIEELLDADYLVGGKMKKKNIKKYIKTIKKFKKIKKTIKNKKSKKY